MTEFDAVLIIDNIQVFVIILEILQEFGVFFKVKSDIHKEAEFNQKK